jgi:hypothetical protein
MAWNLEMIQWLQELSLPTLMHALRTTCHWCTVLMDLCWLEQPECMSQKFKGNVIIIRNEYQIVKGERGGRERMRARERERVPCLSTRAHAKRVATATWLSYVKFILCVSFTNRLCYFVICHRYPPTSSLHFSRQFGVLQFVTLTIACTICLATPNRQVVEK